MAILEKEVWVGINPSNIKHYTKFGYKLPTYINTRGKESVLYGGNILVKIEHLTKNSGARVTKICDDCLKREPNRRYADLAKMIREGDGKHRCKKCARKKCEATKRIIIPYEKTLEYYAKSNNKEYLIREFSANNSKSPLEVHASSNDRYDWICERCGSEFDAKVNNRTSNNCDCPYCANQKVNHTNSLWKTSPEIAKLLVNPEVGHSVTAGSGSKAEFKCLQCGDHFEKFVKNVVNHGVDCVKCSDGISYPEKFMISMFKQLDIEFKVQKTFDWSLNKRYDFYIPSMNCIVETHGEQHYKECFITRRTLEQEQENDKIKHDLAKQFIDHYVVINCSDSDVDFISTNVKSSKLSLFFDLTAVNWLKCHEYACNSLVKTVCDLWTSSNLTTSKIADEVGLDIATVRRYLHQGNSIGWSNYSPKENQKRRDNRHLVHNIKQVVQLKKNGEFIKEWVSIAEASRNNATHHTGIIMCCKGKIKQSGGFKWMYKEDYDKLMENNSILV